MAEHERLEIDRSGHEGTLLPPEQHLALASISQIVGHGEVCTIEVLEWVADRIAAPLPRGARERALSVHRDIEASWEGRSEFVKQWLGESWAGDSWYQAWRGFVEARNAWAHGFGKLTRIQLAQKGTLGYLRTAKLTVSSGVVTPKTTDVRRCAKLGIRLLGALGSLDGRLQA